MAHVPQSCIHGIDARLQAGTVGDLDIEAGTSIDLKDQRPFVFVEDDVNALVAEAGECMSVRGHIQYAGPMRDLDVTYWFARIGMLFHNIVAPNRR